VSSTVTENYLKAVYNAAEWSGKPVTVSVLAGRLGLSASSISEHVRKLTERGLLTHAPYGAIELSDEGRRIALATVRKHRLIETFLVDYLGYGWDEVHDEAEVLEHAVSDLFVERLAARLGDPERDPHGDPIPAADGTLPGEDLVALAALEPGAEAVIVRVWDDDPELLRQLDQLGLTLGTTVGVTARHESVGTVTVERGGTAVTLGLAAAQAIRVRVSRP